MIKPAVFLLIKTTQNVLELVQELKNQEFIKWISPVYGPYQIVVYLEHEDEKELIKISEKIRVMDEIDELDVRIVKIIPKDEDLKAFKIEMKESAVLLINVDYKIEKERVVTWNLRKLNGVKLARAMWGPADIIAIVEARDREPMRDLICDEIKTMSGVKTNSTLYCYPR